MWPDRAFDFAAVVASVGCDPIPTAEIFPHRFLSLFGHVRNRLESFFSNDSMVWEEVVGSVVGEEVHDVSRVVATDDGLQCWPFCQDDVDVKSGFILEPVNLEFRVTLAKLLILQPSKAVRNLRHGFLALDTIYRQKLVGSSHPQHRRSQTFSTSSQPTQNSREKTQ